MGELQKLDPWEQQAVVKSPYMVPAGGGGSKCWGAGLWSPNINAVCTPLGGGPEARVYHTRTRLSTMPSEAEPIWRLSRDQNPVNFLPWRSQEAGLALATALGAAPRE